MNAPLRQREPRYENRKLLDLCHGAPCHLRYPMCTGGMNPNEPSVPAHSNAQIDGKGVGCKSHDLFAVPACPSCHRTHDEGYHLTTEQKQEMFERAWKRWITHLLTAGHIKIVVPQ